MINRRVLSSLLHHPSLTLSALRGRLAYAGQLLSIGVREVVSLYETLPDSELSNQDSVEQIRVLLERTVKAVPYFSNAYLYCVVRRLRPDVVVETGVWLGYSSTFILKALKDNARGTLYSIDLPERSIGGKSGVLVPQELRDNWKLILGTSKEKLPKAIEEATNIDIFIHDSEHTFENMMFEFNTAWPAIRSGGILLSDDVEWNGSFATFCGNTACTWTTSKGHGICSKP